MPFVELAPMTLQLWYDKTQIGRIENPFEHQGTWFGEFHPTTEFACNEQSPRLRHFIEFCRDWYLRSGNSDRADGLEFGQIDDVVGSGLWYTIDENGTKNTIVDAPMFITGLHGEISWILPS